MKRGKNSKKKINSVNLLTAIVLSVASITHLYRVITGSNLIIGSWNVPIWLSCFGVVLAGFLAIHFWKNVNN